MAVETPGMYRKDGIIYKVQQSQQTGKFYVKRLLDGGGFDYNWERDRGVVRSLRAAEMMTLAEAKEYGALYGICCVCGRLLSDENSIAAGIGPICAKGGSGKSRFGWREEIYQTDEERDAAILKEREAEAVAQVKPDAVRTITMGENKYGPVFQIRWEYGDPDFGILKDEIKSWEWQVTKTKWDPAAKCWTIDAKSAEAAGIVLEFATRRAFTVSPEASAQLSTVDPVEVQKEAVQEAINGLPMTFNDLLKVV